MVRIMKTLRPFALCLLLLLPSSVVFANDEAMSEECLRSMRDLYKFYYYEIQPNPKHTPASNEKLTSKETLEMQVVIGELKKNCSPNLIAKVNESLKGQSTAMS